MKGLGVALTNQVDAGRGNTAPALRACMCFSELPANLSSLQKFANTALEIVYQHV